MHKVNKIRRNHSLLTPSFYHSHCLFSPFSFSLFLFSILWWWKNIPFFVFQKRERERDEDFSWLFKKGIQNISWHSWVELQKRRTVRRRRDEEGFREIDGEKEGEKRIKWEMHISREFYWKIQFIASLDQFLTRSEEASFYSCSCSFTLRKSVTTKERRISTSKSLTRRGGRNKMERRRKEATSQIDYMTEKEIKTWFFPHSSQSKDSGSSSEESGSLLWKLWMKSHSGPTRKDQWVRKAS